MIRYFKEGPNGSWRPGVKAIALDMDTMIGTLFHANGKKSEPLEFSSTTVGANIKRGEWMEVQHDDVRRWTSDRPRTPVENAW